MRFVQLENPAVRQGARRYRQADTHAVPKNGGCRLFLGAQYLGVPATLDELENVLAGRERADEGEQPRAGFGTA